jgi:hypothetical protein
MCVCVYVLENITPEPHTQDISADVLRVWLSGYTLQQYDTYIDIHTHSHARYVGAFVCLCNHNTHMFIVRHT